MKIAIGYPPFKTAKGIPQLSQNRQFQWTASGPLSYYIYPVVPASAATLLKSKDYEVVWLDGLAEKWTYEKWLAEIKKEKPDIIALETKTPVIKQYWQVIKDLKSLVTSHPARHASPAGQGLPARLPSEAWRPGALSGWQGEAGRQPPATVLMGDHVTALPEESMKNCPVDFIITGGDYDFLLLNIANHLEKGEKLETGIWYRPKNTSKVCPSKGGQAPRNLTSEVRCTGKFVLNHNLNSLPIIDRELTKWRLYAYKNSNFFRAPGAYTMFGRDCWWGKCTFCSWTTLFPGAYFRSVDVEKALNEVGQLIEKYKVKEIMDDSGSFPNGEWLREFCRGMIEKGYNKKIRFDCNMRFNAGLSKKDYQLMGKAGFRFILYGLESASQETLDKINKNLKVEQIEQILRWAKEGGLMPHLTIMVGYPWEDEQDVQKTIKMASEFFQKGLADSLQATIVIPYPGTPLFAYCKKNRLLKTLDWNRYDMREPIMKAKVSGEKLAAAVRGLYSRSIWTPRFIFNTFSQLKTLDGIKYVGFQALKYLGKLVEFKS